MYEKHLLCIVSFSWICYSDTCTYVILIHEHTMYNDNVYGEYVKETKSATEWKMSARLSWYMYTSYRWYIMLNTFKLSNCPFLLMVLKLYKILALSHWWLIHSFFISKQKNPFCLMLVDEVEKHKPLPYWSMSNVI